MKLPRRRQFLHLAAGAAALPFAPHVARAQAYPSRPVRIIVGFPAGSAPDVVARLIGQWLSERLGQSFVIENRTGAGGTLATEAVVRAQPDGQTLLLVETSSAMNAALYEKLNYNLIRDIAAVASFIRVQMVMVVNPSFPAKTLPEFIAYAKANPGKINMGSPGNGTPQHVAGELFKMMTGVAMTHVPYRGGPPALSDLISGQIQMMPGTVLLVLEHVKSGTLRALAVTDATRSEVLPDVPTIGEFVPGFEATTWLGLGAPKNTPTDIVQKLNIEINASLADPKMRARISELGAAVFAGSAGDFDKHIAQETEKWGKVIRTANIKVE